MRASLLTSLVTFATGFLLHPHPRCCYHCRTRKSGRPQLLLLRARKQNNDESSKRHRTTRNKQRSPESRKLQHRRKRQATAAATSLDENVLQTWRVFGVEVHPDDLVETTNDDDTNDDVITLPVDKKALKSQAVLSALFARLHLSPSAASASSWCWNYSKNNLVELPSGIDDIRVVRQSLDARLYKKRSDGRPMGPRFVFVMDVDLWPKDVDSNVRLKHQPGRMELLMPAKKNVSKDSQTVSPKQTSAEKKHVIVVGAGPAGLFCSLQLARAGVKPILLERGQPVESRGKDIGALMHRRSMDSESNFCFGEGGAGTWSDGKLTTRIGRNSDAVRFVLETLVQYGAPETILVDGAPHLGTDNLVRLLRNMRKDLRQLGGEIRFGTCVEDFVIEDGVVKGVDFVSQPSTERNMGDMQLEDDLQESGRLYGDAVVLATGHSARDVYEKLYISGVKLEPKGFAVGYRVEHPQRIINKIQYGSDWGTTVVTGKKTTDAANQEYFESIELAHNSTEHHEGKLPVPSYRLATDQTSDGNRSRGVYSFCMCPGGQIVPASTDPNEICVNGMSFSRRDSLWANSALVVTISPDDPVLDPYRNDCGVLAGVAFQRDMERRASVLGGGNLTVPVQRLTDFVAGRPSVSAPPSSYRLGVKPAPCHEIYPPCLVTALRQALTENFEKQMPGFVCDEALLHAVETRTSSPVRVSRDRVTMQAIGAKLLFPAGEGAGFAGGIVSAAVDGMAVSDAVLQSLFGPDRAPNKRKATGKQVETFY